MEIQGKLETYKVVSEGKGWSYAVPVVYERRQFLFLKYWSRVWEGYSESAISARNMHPDSMINWFKQTVENYERYKTAWGNYNDLQQKGTR